MGGWVAQCIDDIVSFPSKCSVSFCPSASISNPCSVITFFPTNNYMLLSIPAFSVSSPIAIFRKYQVNTQVNSAFGAC